MLQESNDIFEPNGGGNDEIDCLNALEQHELREIYEFLLTHSPGDAGCHIVYKYRSRGGKYATRYCKFRLGKLRLGVPTLRDLEGADYGHNLHAGEHFINRFVRVSETYIDAKGRHISGTELLQCHRIVVGLDARNALNDYLQACALADALTIKEALEIVEMYNLPRGFVTQAWSEHKLNIRKVRHAGLKRIGLLVHN